MRRPGLIHGSPTLAWPSGGTSAFSTYRVDQNATTSTFTKITSNQPSPSSGSFSTGAAWSPDGNFLAIIMAASQFLWLYQRDGDKFVDITSKLSAQPFSSGNAYGISWHPEGRYLTVSGSGSPYVATYRHNTADNTFTKLANPGTIPDAGSNSCAWNAQGTSLALGIGSSPWINVYNFAESTETFTKLTSPSGAAGTGYSPAWNLTGTKLALGQNASPWIRVWDRSGDVFTGESAPATTPGSNCYIQFTADGTQLIAGSSTSPYIYPYTVNSTTLTYNTATFVGGNPGGNISGGINLSDDERYLAVGLYASPYFCVYAKNGTTFTKLANPSSLPAGNTNGGPVWWPKSSTAGS